MRKLSILIKHLSLQRSQREPPFLWLMLQETGKKKKKNLLTSIKVLHMQQPHCCISTSCKCSCKWSAICMKETWWSLLRCILEGQLVQKDRPPGKEEGLWSPQAWGKKLPPAPGENHTSHSELTAIKAQVQQRKGAPPSHPEVPLLLIEFFLYKVQFSSCTVKHAKLPAYWKRA